MKTLHIVRHGKSSWDLVGISDRDRPLLEKGIANNYRAAERLKLKYLKPDMIYSSPANRAIHTAIIFSWVLETDTELIIIKNSIYETDTKKALELIKTTKADVDNLMIVGHNPVFTDLTNLFLKEHIENLPTSGVATFQFDTKDWDISAKSPISANIDFPKKE